MIEMQLRSSAELVDDQDGEDKTIAGVNEEKK